MKMIKEISERYSPMKFREDIMITESERELMFEAGRWAASSFNEQPWNYLWADKDNPEQYDRILSLLTSYNQQWASSAPLLVVVIGSDKFAKNDKENRHSWYDTGMSVANMVTQAVSMGIQAHQMGGFDSERAERDLEIPDGYTPIAVIAFGHADAPENAEEPFLERAMEPRIRKKLSDFVFMGRFKKN